MYECLNLHILRIFKDIFRLTRSVYMCKISDDYLNSSFEDNRKHRSPSHRLSILQKLRTRTSMSKLKKSKKDNIDNSLEDNIHSNKNGHDFHSNKSSHDYLSNKGGHIGSILARNREREKKEIHVSKSVCLCFSVCLSVIPLHTTSLLSWTNGSMVDSSQLIPREYSL